MIPKILHIVWVGDASRQPDQMIQTWIDRHPGWSVKVWTNEELVAGSWRLRKQLIQLGQTNCAALATAWKWEILLREGGFAVAADSVCVNQIPDDWLSHSMVAMWEQESLHPGLLCGSYIGCTLGHPLMVQMVEEVARADYSAGTNPSEATGAELLTSVFQSGNYTDVVMLPSHVFHPHYPGMDTQVDAQHPPISIELFASRLGLLDALRTLDVEQIAPLATPSTGASVDSSEPAPLFSVVVPTYNRLHTIADAILSISEQGGGDTEIIVIDDGSTDGTYQQLEPHLSAGFRVVRQHNQGAAAARNLGILHARGTYIVWLDSDDVLLPGALDAYRQLLRKATHSPDVLYGDLVVLDIRNGQRGHWKYRQLSSAQQFPKLLEANQYPNPGTAVRRRLYDVIGGYDVDLHASEDYDLWVRAAAAGARFIHVPTDVCEYRLSSDSLSSNEHRNNSADARLVAKALKAQPWPVLFPHLNWKREKEARTLGMLLAAQLLSTRQAWADVAEFAAGLQLNACDMAGVSAGMAPPSSDVVLSPPSQHSAVEARLEEVKQQFRVLTEQPSPRFTIDWNDRWLCLDDNTNTTGFDRHYTYHPAWASRVLAKTRPAHHVDIGSTLAFVTQISAFIETTFYDVRPVDMGLPGLDCRHGNLMGLPFEDNTVDSISCMHVVEHVGLARYGDELDYDGDIKAIRELQRVVSPEGTLLFVVPIGGEARIQFNAHRIYTYAQVMAFFRRDWILEEFSLIPDSPADGGLIIHATEHQADQQRYGCGCFWLRKR